MTKTRYTGHVGKKFHKDKSARKFPGNTVICHVPKDSQCLLVLKEARKEMMEKAWSKKFTFLPPSSFHMTIFEGVCDQVRKEKNWTSKLPLDAPLKDVDAFLKEKWQKIDTNIRFQVKPTHLSLGNVITLRMRPVSDEMEREMRNFRDKLSEAFGIRMFNHNRYGFHISFAYQIEKMSILERLRAVWYSLKVRKKIIQSFGTMETNPPELTFFKDMTNFAPSRDKARQNVRE